MKDSQRMVGALCEGCGLPSSSKRGGVQQRDLGSADKWHARCYRERNRGHVETQYMPTCNADGWTGKRTADKDFAEYQSDKHNKDKHNGRKVPNQKWM